MKLSDIIIEKQSPTSVTISRESWVKIEREILQSEKRLTREDLHKFAGSIHLTEDPVAYQKSIRNEW